MWLIFKNITQNLKKSQYMLHPSKKVRNEVSENNQMTDIHINAELFIIFAFYQINT
jgi:hypothetical protein